MIKYDDSLRGYAHATLERDNFTCRYCGLAGTVWPNWLYLSWDHLLPIGHAHRNDPDFIVAACRFCNESENRRIYDVDDKSPDELVAQKKPHIEAVRKRYKEFWEQHVQKQLPGQDELALA